MKKGIKQPAVILILSGLNLAGAVLSAAEFEVLDKFSVDGYSVLRGSADIPGGGFTVGVSTFIVKAGNVGIGTTAPDANLQVKANYPQISWYSDAAAANTGKWRITGHASDLSLSFQAMNDAWNAAANFMIATRNSGTYTIDKVVFPNGNVGIGTAVFTGVSAPGLVLPNSKGIYGVNGAATTALNMMQLDSSNYVDIGTEANGIRIKAGGTGSRIVEVGAADSCGAGYRCLRVAN